MFGHISQMRKPKFCELVWTPPCFPAHVERMEIGFCYQKPGKTAAEPWETTQPAKILATLHLSTAIPTFFFVVRELSYA